MPIIKLKKILSKILQTIKNRWKLSLVIVIVLALILGYVLKTRASKNEGVVIYQNPVIENITKTLEISGHVNAKEKARLRFLAGGKVVYLGAQEGDFVNKWQTIATIDQASLNKALQKNLNLYMKERWDWEDTTDNNKDQTLDTSERRVVDKEQWDLENSVIDVEMQDIAIQNTAIYAPFEGILTQSPTSVAGVQLSGADYFEIVNPSTLIFRAIVDESDISFIREGQKAELILDSYPDDTITTQVNYIAYTSTETSSGTSFIIEFPLEETSLNQVLRIGMNGDINIILETKENVLTIPTDAITQRESRTYVYLKSDSDQPEEREVKLGLETDDVTEILEGLDENDQVIIPEQ